jgi:hypothetical protein
VSMTLRPYVEAIMSDARYDSIALSCNHLYDDRHYVHIYSAIWNGVDMVDPYVRGLKNFIPYEPGAYQGVPDCFIRPSEKTACLDIPAHFHLRYLKRLDRRNAALRFLSEMCISLRTPNSYGLIDSLSRLIYKDW